MGEKRDRKIPRAAGRLGLLVGSSLAALLGAEAVVRVLLPPPQIVEVAMDPGTRQRLERERGDPLVASAEGTPSGFGLYESTPTGNRLRANARVTIENHDISHLTIEVCTSSIGYRNREVGAKTGTRVLFLGDSITMGDYLPEEQTYVRRVEALANRQGHPLEAINAGVGGISLANELAILVESGLALQPDVVVVGFFLNDGMDLHGVRIFQPPSWLGRSYFLQHVARLLTVRLRAGEEIEAANAALEPLFLRAQRSLPIGPGDPLRDRGAFYGEVLRGLLWWGHAWFEESWRRIPELFGELRRQATGHGFTPLVVCFPVRIQVEADFVEDYPQRMLAQACAPWDLPMLDMLPPLRAAHRESPEPLFFDFCHPTARGNEVIAQHVLRFLRERVPSR